MSQSAILRIVYAALVLASLVGVLTSTADRPALTIKVAFLASDDDEDYAGSVAFKQYIEARSNGRIAVKVYPSGQFCGNERECIEALQSGILEVHMTTVGGFGNVFPPGQVLDLPYAFDNNEIAECVLDGPFVTDLRDEMLRRNLNLRLMAVGNTGGWRNFSSTVRPIKTPADVAGMKIRTTPAAIEQEMVRLFGGNPTPVAWSELYTAFATGVVEGTKNGIQDIVQMKFQDYLKYLTVDEHAYMGALWWYSEPHWRQLSEEDRRLVTEAFAELEAVTRAMPKQREAESFATFAKTGGEIHRLSAEEKDAFRRAASGMRAWFEGEYGREWLDKLDAAVAACRAGPAPAPVP
ncbi:MAG: TRAP transporter substrate-binding protein DctP [Rhodospirillaceae bacterium]|nr:TRAP transporter substrate-binding protein DctP [Rhodospirillaceae bacterium]